MLNFDGNKRVVTAPPAGGADRLPG